MKPTELQPLAPGERYAFCISCQAKEPNGNCNWVAFRDNTETSGLCLQCATVLARILITQFYASRSPRQVQFANDLIAEIRTVRAATGHTVIGKKGKR